MEIDIINYLANNGIYIRSCIDEDTGDTWYVASDLLKGLGYKNPSKTINDKCVNVRKYSFETPGGNQYFLCINFMELVRVLLTLKKEHKFHNLQEYTAYRISR